MPKLVVINGTTVRVQLLAEGGGGDELGGGEAAALAQPTAARAAGRCSRPVP